MWVFCNEKITVYRIEGGRGHEVVLSVLGRDFRGVLISDCFVAYDAAALSGWLKQKCLAHLLKDLATLEAHKRGGALRFAREVSALLRAGSALRAAQSSTAAAEFARQREQIEARLDQLIDMRRRLTDADNMRLAKRLRKQRAHVLHFLYEEAVAATNNAAERALRPAVITRKTGGCNRSAAGARAHEVLASIGATCAQQAVSFLDYLVQLQQFGSTPPSLVPT